MFLTRLAPVCALAAFIVLTPACDPVPADGLEPASELRSVQEQGLVEFLADVELSTEQVLDLECGLRSNAARNIDRYRRGPDERYGTDDDGVIDSEATLDSISQVGPSTIDALYDCADELGYIDDVCDGDDDDDGLDPDGEHEHEHEC